MIFSKAAANLHNYFEIVLAIILIFNAKYIMYAQLFYLYLFCVLLPAISSLNDMKKLSVLILFAFASICCFAQQVVTLTFTARDANNAYCRLDSVSIVNHTQGWQETLYWPDTILTMQDRTGIDEGAFSGSFGLSQNNPNPFNCVTDVNLTLVEYGAVTMEIADINGRTITGTMQAWSLYPGVHNFA